MFNTPTIKLNDGQMIPQLGLGLWRAQDEEAESAVLEAFKVGYRAVDGAAIYRNESGLGRALQKNTIKREEVFITTKLWNDDQGNVQRAFDQSMDKLKLKYLDLYLIHWPAPRKNLYSQAWKDLIELQKTGRVKSIGVSNFHVEHLQRIMDETGIVPVVNQIELHPHFQQKKLRAFHEKHNIATEAWSPLGQGQILNDPVILTIAKKHNKTAAQIILRWHLQNKLIVIPKSVTPSRIRENFDVFGFVLDTNDMSLLNGLDSAEGRIGPNPETADF